MATECNPQLVEYAPVLGREVGAAFDGGTITSDAGPMLLGGANLAIRLTERFCVLLHRLVVGELVAHTFCTTVTLRAFGIALSNARSVRVLDGSSAFRTRFGPNPRAMLPVP